MLNCNVTCDNCGKESGWYTPVRIDKTHRESMAEMCFYEDPETYEALCYECVASKRVKLNKQTGGGCEC
jgi:hypothetical protein